jgi:glutathione peroxidase
MSDIYNFQAKSLKGEEINLKQYEGKVLLIVNTASKCGFTPQFEGLQKLYARYKNDGFEILGFPCDQFGHQEPGTEEDIAQGCVINYGVDFQMFSKISVNGRNSHPLFNYLKSKKGGFFSKRIKWNFTKFLIDRNGTVIERYSPMTDPSKLEPQIKKLL